MDWSWQRRGFVEVELELGVVGVVHRFELHDLPMPLKKPEKPSLLMVFVAQSAIDLYLSEACKRTLMVSRGCPICVVVGEGEGGA